MSTQPTAALRERLFDRVRRSHAHESQFLTRRRDPGAWQRAQPGLSVRPLAETVVACSQMLRLAPGAQLAPSPQHTQAEIVVLEGSLATCAQTLACGDAALAPHRAALAGSEGATVFMRLSAPAAPPARLLSFSTLADDASWADFCPGVRIKPLWDGGVRRSLLVRMRAGAAVAGHGHALEEECLMLAGEAFIGDTLLRSGEYQLAPQGSTHGAVTTDVGALFFVHGSLDPAAYA